MTDTITTTLAAALREHHQALKELLDSARVDITQERVVEVLEQLEWSAREMLSESERLQTTAVPHNTATGNGQRVIAFRDTPEDIRQIVLGLVHALPDDDLVRIGAELGDSVTEGAEGSIDDAASRYAAHMVSVQCASGRALVLLASRLHEEHFRTQPDTDDPDWRRCRHPDCVFARNTVAKARMGDL